MLRFTITWVLEHEKYGRLSHAMEGCLLRRGAGGDLSWHPPLHRTGPVQTRQLHLVSPDYYKLVFNALADTDYARRLVKNAVEVMRESTDPAMAADLPETIGGGD